MSEDEKFMKQALDEAHKAYQKGEIPIGAVVVCNGSVVARGHNMTEMLNDVTAHAEMLAITSAANVLGGKYLKNCTVYVTMEPCAMCAAALGWSQAKRIVFGAEDEKKGYRKTTSCVLHSKTEIAYGVLAKECGDIVKEFFANNCRRKK